MNLDQQDDFWMNKALEQARKAADCGEVPVGAVLICDNTLVAEGHNQSISTHDPSAHAEMVTIREAAVRAQNYRMPGTTLYVTLEPCAMCMGVVLHARVARLVFGAFDPKTGAAGSVIDIPSCRQLNHHLSVNGGVCADQSSTMLKQFFSQRR